MSIQRRNKMSVKVNVKILKQEDIVTLKGPVNATAGTDLELEFETQKTVDELVEWGLIKVLDKAPEAKKEEKVEESKEESKPEETEPKDGEDLSKEEEKEDAKESSKEESEPADAKASKGRGKRSKKGK